MTFAIAQLPQFPDQVADTVTVQLSSLGEDLIVRIPDKQDTPSNWEVYPILGDDPDEPQWQGPSEPTGLWSDELEDMLSAAEIELFIPRTELEKYLNTTVELRYKFADESSLEPCSEPLKLLIRA